MLNLLGTEQIPYDALTAHANLHWYGKTVRPGRKLGHINVVAENYEQLEERVQTIRNQSKFL